ncbi:MAG: hypothetical protein PHD10_01245, partial [Bacilli bacterium]|nr:hypothetical protein [Bacilli bacterium]
TMTKKEFMDYLNKELKGLSLEKQKLILEKMKNEWIPQQIEQKYKNYSLCNKCGKYSLTKNNKIISKEENIVEPTYIDAGYGDDDRYGEVQYLVDYSICPICSKEKQIGKTYIKTLWEKGKYDK